MDIVQGVVGGAIKSVSAYKEGRDRKNDYTHQKEVRDEFLSLDREKHGVTMETETVRKENELLRKEREKIELQMSTLELKRMKQGHQQNEKDEMDKEMQKLSLKLREMEINKHTDKNVMLIKAVDEGDIATLTHLVQCAMELDPDTLSVAHEIASEKNSGTVLKLLGLIQKKIEGRKAAASADSVDSSRGKQLHESKNPWSSLTIESLKKMVQEASTEVWAFKEMGNQIYSGQITMLQGCLRLSSLSERAPPANTVTIPYQEVTNLINRNHIITFLEINLSQVDNSNCENIFLHIQLQGNEGRTKQFELMCTGEDDGISYARTNLLEVESSIDGGIWGGARNDGQDTELQGFTSGSKIVKPIVHGLVAGYFYKTPKRRPTHFIIYTKELEDTMDDTCIGKVVFGINDLNVIYSKAKLHGARFIKIDECGIVLAQEKINRKSNALTIGHLKEMVAGSIPGVWAILRMKNKDYSAQIIMANGHLLLKSLSATTPPADSKTVPYNTVKSLADQNKITIFLEINLSQVDNSTSANIFVHVEIMATEEGRTKQFELMCTGEIDGISYRNTTFLDTQEPPYDGIWGGSRNDGQNTALPGFTSEHNYTCPIFEGLVVGFFHSNQKRKPTNFLIYTKDATVSDDCPIGKVVLGLNDVHIIYSQAKLHQSRSTKIVDCGIVLD